ncbi:hypothetical protein [Roseisolibacter sp. H3M3-2]|uniref:hypothetical protein n=1 Tax=Roseisolibacter sp. H3M3-2 TaxID=3031323 RepID=UPI0023DA6CDC|nr:hypothetical protein [Roseisolibacter sp. H3M3-2]MDF1504631.1 hypothetical protein [Roseisolibacter sp. H3M3-2]
MIDLFGLTLPEGQPIDRDSATLLAGQIGAAAQTVRQGASAAVAARLRQDAQRYLAARRAGGLRFAAGAGRACDEGAWQVMRLTVDAPALMPTPTLLVA